MISRNNRPVVADLANRNRGRVDQARLGRPNASDTEERPVVTADDAEATLTELHDLKRRMTRRTA